MSLKVRGNSPPDLSSKNIIFENKKGFTMKTILNWIKSLFTKKEQYDGPPIVLGLPSIERDLPRLKEHLEF